MYALVRLLKGYPKPLFYKIPPKLSNSGLLGKIVHVELKNQITYALVLKTYKNLPSKSNFEIKEIIQVQDFPQDNLYHNFVEKISKFYFIQPLHFYQRIRSFIFKQKKEKISKPNYEKTNLAPEAQKIILTPEQQKIILSLEREIEKKSYTPCLIHGVTGSGKTEIYKKIIIKCIQKNQSVIFLLPEVSMCIQFQSLLQRELPTNISVIGFHSASNANEKKILWEKLLAKEPILLVGVHLPIILPIPNLGLIIVDEEHETGFQEKKHPKINSKEIAIWRAQHHQIPIVLGSATPSLNSLFNVKTKKWTFFQLKKRFSGCFPKIEIISLKIKGKKRRKSFWISQQLEDAINQTILKKEQVIIYLNRRGYCFFVQCKKCGFTFQCPSCSVSLTLHSDKTCPILRCHYCDYKSKLCGCCPQCHAEDKNLIKKGVGTQQAVNILEKIFPHAKIERADLDSTNKKRSWIQTVEKFAQGEIDILVGTKLVTKGYHFPKVTLVGVLWADLNLHFPLFNASETTLQQLIQVAGRAGRQSEHSKVIVQTMHDHPIFDYLNETDYLKFCTQEMDLRKIANYPPYGRLVQIELKNKDSQVLQKEAAAIYQKLININETKNLDLKILGPTRPIVYKIQKVQILLIFIKSASFKSVAKLLENIDFCTFESKIFIVPTP